jgi:hypothetical protein
LYDAWNSAFTPTNGDLTSRNYVATAYNGKFYDYYSTANNEYFDIEFDRDSLSGDNTLINYSIIAKSGASQLSDGTTIDIPVMFDS